MKPLILTITVSALALGAFVWFLPEGLGAQRASTFTHDPTRDPKPGLSIAEPSVPTTDVLGRAIPIEQRKDVLNATWIGRLYDFDDGGLRDMQQDLDDKGWGG